MSIDSPLSASLVPVVTPACCVCGRATTLEVAPEAYDAWKRGALIQDAFAHESEDLREMLQTGIHPDCWDSMFAGEDEA